ncbi:MAG: bifunctional phosphoribosyl-AMP cyclohydrolase/phosphoribosyl-ATP diphosphatase HisIE [Thermoleophilaceae bacterium]|nr:bifunctional phosphoribosyl-AMP cyclohydrolase/phosphoribosyl-ATP diphosphatase HisIE [Thermoleophilaceae bacterium]
MTEQPPLESTIAFDERGLAPCIAQDYRSGAVLTLAYVNAESLAKTRETGDLWFFSRSRNELWHKGATSGDYLRVKEMRYDCDADAVLALVEPVGAACHTGELSCFYRAEGGEPQLQPFEAAGELQRTLDARREQMPEGSYTTRLLGDRNFAIEKVLEEAEEVTRAARAESDERVAEEAADLLYHLAVLMTGREMTIQQALEVLAARSGTPARHSTPEGGGTP